MEVGLTQGKVAMIDPEDWPLVKDYSWFAVHKGGDKWYAAARVKGETVFMHRLLLGLAKGDPREGDHKSGDSLDCRRENLRITGGNGNKQNRRPRRNSRSGYKGVYPANGRWRAVIGHDGVQRHLGLFDTPEAAAKSYDEAAKELFGEYAWLNFNLVA